MIHTVDDIVRYNLFLLADCQIVWFVGILWLDSLTDCICHRVICYLMGSRFHNDREALERLILNFAVRHTYRLSKFPTILIVAYHLCLQ